mgnify:CR=1 FL=1
MLNTGQVNYQIHHTNNIIVANGGLEPNDNSYFTKNFGLKLKIVISEEDSWSALNSGRICATATTDASP